MNKCSMCKKFIMENEDLCDRCKVELYGILEEEYEKRKVEGIGIEIYSKEQMEDALSEIMEKLVEDIKVRIKDEIGIIGHFNETYEIKSKGKGILLKFRMKNKGLKLEYDCGEIEGYRGEVVVCELYFKINGEIVEQTYIEMINADYEEVDEKIIPERNFQLDDSDIGEFINRVITVVSNNYN